MSEKPNKSGSKQNKKAGLSTQPRNRYHRRAKLSEHRFLRVLRCFCDEKTVEDTAEETRITPRTIRDLYGRFREALLRAALEEPFAFGWTGYFLFEKQELSPRGNAIMDAIAGSEMMRKALNHHGIRAGITGEKPDPRFSYFLFEVAARVFCALSMSKDNDTLYSDEIHEAYAGLQLIALYIYMHKDNPDDPELFEAVTTSFERIMRDFPKLLDLEELAHLISGFAPHRYGTQVLYDDLRRYLAKNPL
ncbi:MAG: hypothetical protein JJ959_02865 [Nisaea sp.]|uniref:hypothetical protein n=1 Tax=Nisaea sp. TaxID=2024842 RepID=UPI001B261FEE|nr:hypothetical protein [Nisaea sp.]MBO6559445.1 hypothetical protein [Nisaea sp.]